MSQRVQQPKVEIGTIAIDTDMTLRRMIIHPSEPKGTVLLLHGFPETLYAWRDIALALADDYEVHAFDWPGFGLSSRPPVDRFSRRKWGSSSQTGSRRASSFFPASGITLISRPRAKPSTKSAPHFARQGNVDFVRFLVEKALVHDVDGGSA